MFNGKTAVAILAVTLIVVSAGLAQTLEEDWNNFLHYTKIGRPDLAKGYAQVIMQGNPDPVKLLELTKNNPQGYAILLRVNEFAPDPELEELSGKIIDLIEQGSFTRRADAGIIVTEIRRLSSNERGWFTAVKRLRNAGEYAIPFMLDAIADNSRDAELPNIVRALPQIGRDAIRPLGAALQTDNVALKDQIVQALGKIGYPQSQAYLKYIVENDASAEVRQQATISLMKIDPGTLKISASQLFFELAEKYYYHSQSLTPANDSDSANIWFWDANQQRLARVEVSGGYFYELMAMRCCEWALKADAGFGPAIGLWIAAFFKAESAGIETMPSYFGQNHADALVYATTAGVEYLHQALARAVKDKNAHVALGVIEALGTTAGEKSLLYRIGPAQPLLEALSFDDIKVRYSAAIAVAAAGPKEPFAESKLVVANLAQALGANTQLGEQVADSYALRAAQAMLKLAVSRNPVINLSAAQNALVSAVNDERKEIQILSGQILAHLDSPAAQRAIAGMALDNNNDADVRISAFDSLATSAKLNANMLVDPMIDAIYSLISSDETDPELRSAAAAAYGSLNLPSQKVKDLILDQAKS
ncbi:MAG: HEAT repeat domain-containing protein [Sedimentisphaerales bacterium]|nr:HEAT repeat domain-containing protein [Sedimentisphaerales bacterium]